MLIVAKRSDAIASGVAIHTEKNTEELKTLMEENTSLTVQVKKKTDLLEDIHRHIARLDPEDIEHPVGETAPSSFS